MSCDVHPPSRLRQRRGKINTGSPAGQLKIVEVAWSELAGAAAAAVGENGDGKVDDWVCLFSHYFSINGPFCAPIFFDGLCDDGRCIGYGGLIDLV